MRERVCVCARYSSLTSVRGRTSAPTLVMMRSQSSSRMRKKSARSLAQRTQFREDSHTRVGKNYPVEQIKAKNKKTTLQLRSSLFCFCLSFCFKTCVKSAARKRAASRFPPFTALRTPHGLCYGGAYSCIGSSTEVVGLPSAMRPLPIINGKEERREKGEGRLVAALATALLSATARF